jgi:hypothetical protein
MYNANMPTIFVIGPFKIVINTADHRPAHVHCVGPGIVLVVEIRTRNIIRNKGVASKDVKRLLVLIEEYEDVLMNEWRRYHEED